MVDDLSDVWKELRALKAEVRQARTATPLENASVTNGRVRLIGGTLRVDSGGTVEIVGTLSIDGTTGITGPTTITGTLSIDGTTDITGPTTITGDLDVNGPWELNGDGDISGDVDLTGRMTLEGGTPIRLVPGTGSTAARIRLGLGSQDAVLRGGQGLGKLETPDGENGVSAGSGGARLYYGDEGGSLPTGVSIGVSSQGPYINGLETLPSEATGARYLAEWNGVIYRTSGVGGGGGSGPGPIAGSFMWPFDPSTTDPVLGVFGMRLNPVTGVWAMHNGQDFSVPGGSPIPSAGDGQVSAKGFDGGRGNYIVIDHGGGVTTHYFHMQAASPLSVGDPVEMGVTIGAVGTTGSSTGNHLHWEVHVDGTPVDPAVFMAGQEDA